MRDLTLRLQFAVQRQLEFTHRHEFGVEETVNEATVEWHWVVEHVPTIVGSLFS